MGAGKSVIFVLLIALLMIYNMISISPFNSLLFDVGFFFMVVGFFIFIKYSKKNNLLDCWLRPSYLFLIGYFAVNLQYLLDYRLGLKDDGSTLITQPQTLNYCLVLGVAGFLAFVLGYIWKRTSVVHRSVVNASLYNLEIPPFFILFHFAMFCLFLLTINVSEFLMGSAFIDEENQSPFEGLFFLATMLLVLFTSKKGVSGDSLMSYLRLFPKISLFLIGFYMMLRMFSGDRGPMIYTGLLMMYGYIAATKKRWKLSLVLPLLIVASLFVSLIGMARVGDLHESFFDRIVNSYTSYTTAGRFGESGEKSVFSATEELGFSFMVNQTDVKAIEQDGLSFHYGMYQIYSLLVAIPYMPSFLAETLKISKEDLSSVGFANTHFFQNETSTWSLGTTMVGDFYLELGIIGVIIGLFFCGKLFRFIDQTIFISSPSSINIYLLFIALHFASQAIYMPRSVMLLNLQKVLLGFILIYFYQKIIVRSQKS